MVEVHKFLSPGGGSGGLLLYEGLVIAARKGKGCGLGQCCRVKIPHQGIWLWASAFSPGLLLAQEKMLDSGEALVCLEELEEVVVVKLASAHRAKWESSAAILWGLVGVDPG